MIVKRLTTPGNIIDVFTGSTWNNWTRLAIIKHKDDVFLKYIRGITMTPSEFKELKHLLGV